MLVYPKTWTQNTCTNFNLHCIHLEQNHWQGQFIEGETAYIYQFSNTSLFEKISQMLYIYIIVSYVKSLTVWSDPLEKTQGWVGWNSQHNTPRSLVAWWPLKTLTGTISGFCRRSLQGQTQQTKSFPMDKKPYVLAGFKLMCTLLH